MSFDGPCSVLPGGMRGFPFETAARNDSSARVSSTIDQVQRQQQQHSRQIRQQQQHQPTVPSFAALGTGIRKMSGDRRENAMRMLSCSSSGDPSTIFTLPVVSSSASRRGAASPEWDTDDLPDMLASPRLRSVSSLVLSSDTEAEIRPLAVESLASSVAGVRTTTMRPTPAPAPALSTTGWGTNIADILANSMQPLPPPVIGGNDGLVREQSFPPPISNFPPGPRLSHDQSFPPPGQPGMVLAGSVLSPSGWREDRMATSTSGVLGSGSVGGAVGIGEEGEFHRFGGERLSPTEVIELERSCGNEQRWDVEDTVSSHSGNDEDALFSSGSFRPDRPDRHPSFDKLAAMIPGIPQHFQPPSSASSASASPASAAQANSSCRRSGGGKAEQMARAVLPRDTIPATTTATAASVSIASAPTPTPGRGRPPGKRRHDTHKAPCRTKVRTSNSRRSGKVDEQRGSCGPARRDGGGVDVAKQERRRAAIQRYLVKKTRRRFANATRDNSPSRSRPKAAKIRPRLHGKFVKTVPDFIPVTAVSGEAGGSGETEVRRMARVQRAAAARGKGAGRGRAVKKEVFRAPVVGTSLRNASTIPSSFQGYPAIGGNGAGVPPVSGGVGSGYLWTPPSSM